MSLKIVLNSHNPVCDCDTLVSVTRLVVFTHLISVTQTGLELFCCKLRKAGFHLGSPNTGAALAGESPNIFTRDFPINLKTSALRPEPKHRWSKAFNP